MRTAATFVSPPPDLSSRYADAVAMLISPQEPSCGRAAYTGEAEIVRDVEADPLWAPYLELAHEHEIRACWSFPLHAADGAVIGTYAVYHRTPREPEARDLERVALLLQTAAIIIERHKEAEVRSQAEAALRESEADARFLAALGERIRLTQDPVELLFEVSRLLGDYLDSAQLLRGDREAMTGASFAGLLTRGGVVAVIRIPKTAPSLSRK